MFVVERESCMLPAWWCCPCQVCVPPLSRESSRLHGWHSCLRWLAVEGAKDVALHGCSSLHILFPQVPGCQQSDCGCHVLFFYPFHFLLLPNFWEISSLPQFKDHLKKAEAVSEFAKSKTIAEQRRFLPVYGVREEMLQVRPQAG